MLDVLRSEYVRTAAAKGLAHRKVILKHALKNALIPVVTVAGLQAGILLGGTVVVEEVFTLPGVGRLVLWSIYQRDYPVTQSTILFIAVLFMPRRGRVASRLASPRMSRVEQPSSKQVAMTAAISVGNPGSLYSSLNRAMVVSQPLAF